MSRSWRPSRRRPTRAALPAAGPVLTLALPDGSRLALDVRAPDALLEVPAGRPGPRLAGALLVEDRRPESAALLPDGGLAVGRALLWSLLDPRHARGEPLESDDPVGAERRLRQEARRFWTRLRWWGALGPDLRRRCGDLVAAGLPAAAPLVDLLDDLAAGGADPFDGWSPAEPADGGDTEAAPAAPPAPAPSGGAVASWMTAPDGLGALFGPGFAPRQEQADMAGAVAAALAEQRALLVEAGTGVGKTLAYLVPLVIEARRRGWRAVVATHTRALQAQILEQDLPRLRRWLPDLEAVLLMGRTNYLCRQARERFQAHAESNPSEAVAAACLRLWLADTQEGLREEIEAHPVLARHARELFDSPLPCSPTACHERGACFVQQARRRAREAELIVVNHALLLHDRVAEGTLIGPYGLLVVDEAHRLPRVALEVHAVRCAPRRLEGLRDLLGSATAAGSPLLGALAARLDAAGQEGRRAAALLPDLAAALDGSFAAHAAWWRALQEAWAPRLPANGREGLRLRVREPRDAFAPVAEATARLLERTGAVAAAIGLLGARLEEVAEPEGELQDRLAEIAQAGQLVGALERDVRFLSGGPGQEWVVWIEASGGLPEAVAATPLESGELLRDFWLERSLHPVLTSATLAVGEDFGHMIAELGLGRRTPPARTALAPSPFDYERQALLLTATSLPAPDSSAFPAAVAEVLRELRRRVGRRTLVLFTSHQMLREVEADLLREAEPADLFTAGGVAPGPLLAQSPRQGAAALARDFRRARGAMLLGTATFWEGVDFPGSDLEVLVVVRLPFLVPNDPWVEARCERIHALGEDPFTSFMVRDAVLRLRQGLGRLIRRPTDRGVFVLLDGRLHSRPYGLTFARSLPAPARPCADAAELAARAAAFFAGAAAPGGREGT